ncbi:MAG: DUF6364 family protein [Acidobacteria bacterium]|nr:DUF6364 family protein [Acidobacteriota bacterium]
MSKLTLSVDAAVIARAKRYARLRGLSVSQMVETYLTSVSAPSAWAEAPPILRALRGTLSQANVEEYRRRLREKHR